MQGGGGARPAWAKDEEGEGARLGGPARGPDGQWAGERRKKKKKIEINFKFDFQF
jgi:hypothetical protein